MAIDTNNIRYIEQGEAYDESVLNRPIEDLVDELVPVLNDLNLKDALLFDGEPPAFYRNASNLNTGTVAGARLGGNQTMGGNKIFTGSVTIQGNGQVDGDLTVGGNIIAEEFYGDGSGLTGVRRDATY